VRTAQGSPKFDALFLGEVRLNVLAAPDIHLEVVVGYLDSKTGRRFGSFTKPGGWGPETLRCLAAFLEAVETDVAAEVFEGGATGGGSATTETTIDGTPGL
jgi:hypothetical protein